MNAGVCPHLDRRVAAATPGRCRKRAKTSGNPILAGSDTKDDTSCRDDTYRQFCVLTALAIAMMMRTSTIKCSGPFLVMALLILGLWWLHLSSSCSDSYTVSVCVCVCLFATAHGPRHNRLMRAPRSPVQSVVDFAPPGLGCKARLLSPRPQTPRPVLLSLVWEMDCDIGMDRHEVRDFQGSLNRCCEP